MIAATEALTLLKEGNLRFVGGSEIHNKRSEQRRAELLSGQNPFATILGCSDSRAPAELVFDQGLGDLFVIRVAGNIVAPSQVASIEYAASVLFSRLIVVMGHSGCGAVKATLESFREGSPPPPGSLYSIVERIGPSVRDLWDAQKEIDEELIDRAVEANVKSSVADLRKNSELLNQLEDSGELLIIGAVYSLETGQVTFFD